NLRLATSTDVCAAKEEKNPICTPKLGDPIPDAGISQGDDSGVKPSAFAIAEDFPTSLAITGDTLYFASQSRVGSVPLGIPNAPATPLPGVPGGAHVPWRFGAGFGGGGLALANGSGTGYAINGGPGTAVTIPGNAVAVAPLGGQQAVWGVGGGNGGLFLSPPSPATRLELPTLDVTALSASTSATAVIVGDAAGNVRVCPTNGFGQCGQPASVGSRVEGFAPRDSVSGYVLTTSGVFKAAIDPATGSASAQPFADSSNPAIVEGTSYFARAIAASGPCVVFSAAEGLKLAIDGMGGAMVIVPSVTDRPILGVAVGPDSAGHGMAAYYTVFAPRDMNGGVPAAGGVRGGGIYAITLPPQCGGTSTSLPDAGAKDSGAGVDSGAVGDGGAGGTCNNITCANGCCTGANTCLTSVNQDVNFCGAGGAKCMPCNGAGGEICQPNGNGGMCFLP
ncbi:MAG: hypothetical protein JWP87_4895, partial [Labilithrix sp.]|nr:hypothetical protein [Labilithrix sp.]